MIDRTVEIKEVPFHGSPPTVRPKRSTPPSGRTTDRLLHGRAKNTTVTTGSPSTATKLIPPSSRPSPHKLKRPTGGAGLWNRIKGSWSLRLGRDRRRSRTPVRLSDEISTMASSHTFLLQPMQRRTVRLRSASSVPAGRSRSVSSRKQEAGLAQYQFGTPRLVPPHHPGDARHSFLCRAAPCRRGARPCGQAGSDRQHSGRIGSNHHQSPDRASAAGPATQSIVHR